MIECVSSSRMRMSFYYRLNGFSGISVSYLWSEDMSYSSQTSQKSHLAETTPTFDYSGNDRFFFFWGGELTLNIILISLYILLFVLRLSIPIGLVQMSKKISFHKGEKNIKNL